MMADEQQTPYQPYFETPADFQFKIIDPDAKDVFKNFREINKDIVTANLKDREINLLLYGDSIIGICDVAKPYLDAFQENMARDLMIISNASKGRNGFLLKRFTEHHFIKTDRFSKAKPENKIGD
jgi:hypothetical protein